MKPTRNYLTRFSIGMIGFAVLLVIALFAAQALIETPWRYVIILLPVPATAWIGYAIYRYIVEADELQSKIIVEALAIGFAGGSVITFGWGLLQSVGAPPVNWMFVFTVYAGCWLIGGFISRRRYG